jgi:8-oxo-dGTP pyrophosphatase MutT (NUDIX family)
VTGAPELVRAAGGVVTRTADGGTEFLVVHRPRYDDWSLPKGKLEPDESPEAGAAREIAEETGVKVRLGDALPDHEYIDRHGRPKIVHYWEMTPVGTIEWAPNDEVDEARWIRAAEAATLLSYENDRRLVARVAAIRSGGSA